MTTITLPLRQSRLMQFFASAFAASPILSTNAVFMSLCAVCCVGLQFVDARELYGISVWVKPAKFYTSLAVHFFTVAWAMSLAPEIAAKRSVRWSVWALLLSAWGELFYITYRASQGEASHFNVGTALNSALYNLMGIGSVVLVVAPMVIATVAWRAKPQSFMREAVAIGFAVAMVLALVVGFTLGGNTSHWIGGDQTDATGLSIFKWSTTGGDLRVAHFVGLHAMQIVPLSAVSGRRVVVLATACCITIVTLLAYWQALNGVPLFRT